MLAQVTFRVITFTPARLFPRSSVHRCDIMNPFFLGYLYLYMVITPTAGIGTWVHSHLRGSFSNITDILLIYYTFINNTCTNAQCDSTDSCYAYNSTEETWPKNCTQCNVKPNTSCLCLENTGPKGECIIYCPKNEECCLCDNCSLCWSAEWQLMTMTHISVSILFGLGITGLILMYCKLCNRTRRLARTRCLRVQQELNGTSYCNTIEDSRERPPLYSEVCGAPPLYTSPYNMASMQDVPPRYPDTPKSQERCRCFRDTTPSVPPVAQHM
ncbi:PREDICTED: uncharacterized protein LOC106748011 [Dinoponera quadriceps]|uniref:Uncharacterized protein LOC106748011 n=1 Tax=Dinoponera quadriceps TaxID=609295 RepID=A0A6P3XSZ4_DINQU|nr:PREDICTED: uncharacterized protein LOC106748011 [Dinoponera quadriceps]